MGALRLCLLGLAAVSLTLGACGGPPRKTDDMTTFERLRGDEEAARIKERFPELVAEADKGYKQAVEAHEDGETEDTLHYTRLATFKFRTAAALSRTQDAQDSQRAAENRLKQADEELVVQQRRREVAVSAVAQLKKIVDLQGQMTTGEKAGKVNAVRQKIKDAVGMDAAKYDAGLLSRAEASLKSAQDALDGGKINQVDRLADVANADADALIAAIKPRYDVDKRQSDIQTRLQALLDSSGNVPGAKGRIVQRGFILTLRGTFASNKTAILPDQVFAVERVVELAKNFAEFKVLIEGHTDNQGGAQKNLVLSQARAQSVQNFLIERGVDPTRLSAVGKGGEEPVADNRKKEGREENRRVDIVFLRPAN